MSVVISTTVLPASHAQREQYDSDYPLYGWLFAKLHHHVVPIPVEDCGNYNPNEEAFAKRYSAMSLSLERWGLPCLRAVAPEGMCFHDPSDALNNGYLDSVVGHNQLDLMAWVSTFDLETMPERTGELS